MLLAIGLLMLVLLPDLPAPPAIHQAGPAPAAQLPADRRAGAGLDRHPTAADGRVLAAAEQGHSTWPAARPCARSCWTTSPKTATARMPYSVLPAREEFYAYIGLTPFLALSLLPLALWKRARRPHRLLHPAAGADRRLDQPGDACPGRQSSSSTRLFIQFRHLLRILIFGSFALITLAGLGLDTLWGAFAGMLRTRPGRTPATASPARQSAAASAPCRAGHPGRLYAVRAAGCVQYQPGHPAHPGRSTSRLSPVQGWVRQNDPCGLLRPPHARPTPGMRPPSPTACAIIDVWYHFADIRSLEDKINQRWVQAQPNYLIQSPQEPAPENGELIQVIEGYQYLPPAREPADGLPGRAGCAGAGEQPVAAGAARSPRWRPSSPAPARSS